MAKPELGTKRICPETGRKFYDLNKNPVISPYTGKVVPIVTAPVRAPKAEPAAPVAAARPVPVAEAEAIVPETADAEFVSLEDAEAEQQGKKTAGAPAEVAEAEEEAVPGAEPIDDAVFIEEQEEGDPDVSDIIGEGVEKEEET